MVTIIGREKFNWINSLKGLAILAVVLGHIASPLTRFIFSWHIPLFFFLSGFLLTRDNLLSSVKKDIRRLFVPYFIFGLLSILAEFLKRQFWPNFDYIYSTFSIKDELISLVLWMDAGKIHTYGFVLWFLPALFWSKNMVILLHKILRNNWLVLAVGLLLWFLMVNQKEIWYFGLDKAMISIVWVALGKLVRVNIHRVLHNPLLTILLGISIILIPIPELNMAFKIAESPVINILYAFGIIMELVFIFRNINTKILSVLGEKSMLIYGLHPYTNNLAYILIFSRYKEGWWLQFIVSMLCLFVILWIRNVGQKTKYANLVNWI